MFNTSNMKVSISCRMSWFERTFLSSEALISKSRSSDRFSVFSFAMETCKVFKSFSVTYVFQFRLICMLCRGNMALIWKGKRLEVNSGTDYFHKNPMHIKMNVNIYLFYSMSSKDVAWLYPIMDSLTVKYTWWQQQMILYWTLKTWKRKWD